MIVFATSAITFTVSYASSIFSTAVTPVAIEFHTSEEVAILGVSLYVLGFALGKSAFSGDPVLY
jgi:DHA1 family multidrug resistance protein-like MFS transporter